MTSLLSIEMMMMMVMMMMMMTNNDDYNRLLKSLQGVTIINNVTHDPFAAHDLAKVLDEYKVHHVSALLSGVPDTVCGSMAKTLFGAPDRTIPIIRNNDDTDDIDNDDDNNSNDWGFVSKLLRHLGTVHNFSGGFNDDNQNEGAEEEEEEKETLV